MPLHALLDIAAENDRFRSLSTDVRAGGPVKSHMSAAVQPFLAANKPVFLLDYTNVARRMNEHCAAATKIGVPLVFKTQYLNGKLHRRCP